MQKEEARLSMDNEFRCQYEEVEYIGDLSEKIIDDYKSGIFTTMDGNYIHPDKIVKFFKREAVAQGFTNDLIENTAEELYLVLEAHLDEERSNI
jgi:hypothetical protein